GEGALAGEADEAAGDRAALRWRPGLRLRATELGLERHELVSGRRPHAAAMLLRRYAEAAASSSAASSRQAEGRPGGGGSPPPRKRPRYPSPSAVSAAAPSA